MDGNFDKKGKKNLLMIFTLVMKIPREAIEMTLNL